MNGNKKLSPEVERIAKAAKQSRRIKRILPSVISLIAALLVVVYVLSLLFSQYGSFTITVKDFGDRSYALSLSENHSFRQSTSRLNAVAIKDVDNVTYTNLPDDLNDVDGAHNGENYLAYTFYVKNVGEKECNYKYTMSIVQATVGVDAAVRVRIYFNPDYYKAESGTYTHSGAYTDYAKPKTGGNGQPEIDPGNRVMTNFYSNDVVVTKQISSFKPGDIAKMTVVIWLEGEDPDCTDDVLGGRFKTDMDVEIVSASK